MDLNSHLICCLCNFNAASENDLESHIDNAHSDIFRPAQAIEVDTSASNYVLASNYQSPTEEDFEQVQSMFNDEPSHSIYVVEPQNYNQAEDNLSTVDFQLQEVAVKKERRKRFSMPETASIWAEAASEDHPKRQSFQDATTIPTLVQPAKRGRKSKAFLQQQQELQQQQQLLDLNQGDVLPAAVSKAVVPFKKGRSGRFSSYFPQPQPIQYEDVAEIEPKIPEPDVTANFPVQPVVKSGKRGRKSKAFLQQQLLAAEETEQAAQQSEIIGHEPIPVSLNAQRFGKIDLDTSNNCKKRKSEDVLLDPQTQLLKEALGNVLLFSNILWYVFIFIFNFAN